MDSREAATAERHWISVGAQSLYVSGSRAEGWRRGRRLNRRERS